MMDALIHAAAGIGAELALGLIGIAAAWLTVKARKTLAAIEEKTKIEIDERFKAALEKAIFTAAEGLGARATPEGIAGYLRQFNPGTLAHFKLDADPAALRERIKVALGGA